MSRRLFVGTRVLKEGMKIDQSIIDKTGRVLIARGTILDTYLIEGLRRLSINGVYIREGEDDEPVNSDKTETVAEPAQQKIDKLSVTDRNRVNLSESVKKRVQEGISYLYSNVGSKNIADTTNQNNSYF